MTLCTDKDLKSKNFKRKKVYILAKDSDAKRKFKIKAKKIPSFSFVNYPRSLRVKSNVLK